MEEGLLRPEDREMVDRGDREILGRVDREMVDRVDREMVDRVDREMVALKVRIESSSGLDTLKISLLASLAVITQRLHSVIFITTIIISIISRISIVIILTLILHSAKQGPCLMAVCEARCGRLPSAWLGRSSIPPHWSVGHFPYVGLTQFCLKYKQFFLFFVCLNR